MRQHHDEGCLTMKITQQHPIRGDWSVLTETSAPRLFGPTGDGCGLIFSCYGIAKNGDRIEYRLSFTRNELATIRRASV